MAEVSKKYDCPATGFKSKCRRDGCPEWVHILGKHPQSGETVNMMDCARRWMPVLLINLGNEMRQTAAAVESMRNEIAKGDLANVDAARELVKGLRDALEKRPALEHRPG